MKRRIVAEADYLPVLEDLVSQGHEVSFLITGNSMAPFLIHARDHILIAKPQHPMKKGDMAFFRRKNGKYVMHRICLVDRDGNYYLIGDAQNQVEGPIQPEQVFGKITAVCRNGKWIRPGDFWWEFFEHFWLKIIPLRRMICIVYAFISKRKHNRA